MVSAKAISKVDIGVTKSPLLLLKVKPMRRCLRSSKELSWVLLTGISLVSDYKAYSHGEGCFCNINLTTLTLGVKN